MSDYGYYLFLFKLFVHFTRIREGVSRTLTQETQGVSEPHTLYQTYAI